MTEVVLKGGLTTKSIALAIPLALIYSYLSVLVGLYTDKPSTFGTFILPMIYLVVIFELLGRTNSKLRLTPQEFVFVFSVVSFLGMHSYLTLHAAGHNNPLSFPLQGALSDYVAFGIDSLRDYWSQAVPTLVIPPAPVRFDIAQMLLNGKSVGQEVPWGYLMPAIVYWGLVFVFYSFISIFVTFAVGKIWVEEERLVFPLAVPSLYLFETTGEVVPETRKSRLFDLKIPSTKVFWATFVIGALLGITPLITEIFPAFPVGAWWGETKIDIGFLATLWPGVYASFIFNVPQIAVGLIMPNDVLISLILAWVIFGVLYQGIGVAMGIVPYTPGVEFVWPWETYPGTQMPFPYRELAANGISVGIIIWTLARNRKRVLEVFSTLWKKDIDERGLSLRLVSMLLLVGGLGWWVLMLMEGADPLLAFLVPIWAFLFNILYARIYAEVFWHVGTGWGAIWDVTFMVGSVTRGWTTPTWDQPMTDPAWFTVARHVSNIDNWMISFSPMSSGHMVTLYKLAYDLKMKLKDLLIALIIGMIVLAFVFMPLDMFFMFHTKGGLSQLTQLNSWWPWIAAGRYHRGRWVLEGLTWEYQLGVIYGGGILLSLVLYVLKTRVPLFWFVNVPALYVGITIPTYMWMTSLIALIIKYIAIRTVGLRKYEQYAMPVVAGLILGFGAMWLPAALINLGGVVIPKSIDLYQP